MPRASRRRKPKRNHAAIHLRGVRVHNLQNIDLDVPLRRLTVVSGVSGSGKSSLAVDTLYAEGQRRYIETFSAYTRQFLEQLDKPDADSIEAIPPAIAIAAKSTGQGSRSTVGTVTEINDYLRLLFAKVGRVVCRQCGEPVRQESAQSVAEAAAALPAGTRYMIAYPVEPLREAELEELSLALREDGFVRVLAGDCLINLNQQLLTLPCPPSQGGQGGRDGRTLHVVVDRLTAGQTAPERITDSVELAFDRSQGRCTLVVEQAVARQAPNAHRAAAGSPFPTEDSPDPRNESPASTALPLSPSPPLPQPPAWSLCPFSRHLRCDRCQIDYPHPEPRLYSFNSPLGACPTCKGFGDIIDLDMDLVVPDPGKTIRQGAIAPWNSPAYAHELDELLDLAGDYGIPVDVPFRDLEPRHLELIRQGVPERDFGGLRGFFNWLERRKYKMHIRVFLSRWRSYRTCPNCGGTRLKDLALCTQVGGRNIAEVCAMKIRDALRFFDELELSDYERRVAKMMLDQVRSRLGYLQAVGLDYLTLQRMSRTLSGGESQRVALTAALGSSLVNTLYVLDEPSIGLHPRDNDRLIKVLQDLRDACNTVVVVEHDEAIINSADLVVDMGPGAGEAGGRVVFHGSPAELAAAPASVTGAFLSGRRRISLPPARRRAERGWIRLSGARGNNLKNLQVEFPLGVLCVVTGVSGSGKSTLIQDTLYPALCRRMRKQGPRPAPYEEVLGDGQIDDCILVDQSPPGRSARSNPITYVKAFDEIRRAFAATREARLRNYGAGHFSFNVPGGRCEACQGNGFTTVDMQFLPDVIMSCSECGGSRFGKETLEIQFRGKNIAEILDLTVREAFVFFRGQPRIQTKLKRLIDVGLEYLRLGQATSTLSAGEAQRLKLAGFLSSSPRQRCLFLLDEPTTGLHFADIVQLLDSFNALLSVGHSLIVVEHNLQIIKCADYIIDLGPGAADEGGTVVALGTPEELAREPASITGRFLAGVLQRDRAAQQSA